MVEKRIANSDGRTDGLTVSYDVLTNGRKAGPIFKRIYMLNTISGAGGNSEQSGNVEEEKIP